MLTQQEYHDLYDRLGQLKETVIDRLAPELIQNPQLADELIRYIDTRVETALQAATSGPQPPDGGLAQLAGVGPDAAQRLGDTRIAPFVDVYDEAVTSERIQAVGDLYYFYQLERTGVLQAVLKLQELFRAGTVRLSDGDGAYRLYQFDRKQVLRYTKRERMQAYQRVFGYTKSQPPVGARPNREFHPMFVHFNEQVARFFRDKRISEVIRARANDPSFGSIAVVRRAGLDLRNNLKHASYGHINVLRVELLQLLEEAFKILGSPDIRKLFGADNAWDTAEEVMRRYLNRSHVHASPRSRMAITGRDILRWLAQPHILNATRAEFEALLLDIADEAEEWLTSAQSLAIVRASRNGTAPVRIRLPATEWEQAMYAE